MWIFRFQNLKPKDYNYIKRIFEKINFFPKKISGIIFIKSIFFHILQKKSWRKISEILDCNHIVLFNFYNKFKENEEIKKIFLYFAEKRIIIFVDEKIKTFTNNDLDENIIFLENTKKELENIFKIFSL